MDRLKSYILIIIILAIFVFSSRLVWAEDFILGPETSFAHRTKNVSPAAALLSNEGNIYVSWIEEEKGVNSLYFSSSSDGGKTFSPPVKLNSFADEPSALKDGPAMALGKNGEIYLAWTSAKEDFKGNIMFSRSSDGKAFSPSVRVNDNPAPAQAGFESMTVSLSGNIFISWIDGREGSPSLYMAASKDGGRSFEKNTRIDGDVCPCCRTSITSASDEAIYIAWRKAFADEIREVMVSSSTDGGKSFTKPVVVGNDRWRISGCPHRGPSIGVASGGTLFATWYAEGEGLPRIYIAESRDGGKSFTKTAIPVDRGYFPDHPSLAIFKESAILVWEEVTPVVSRIIVGVFKDSRITKKQANEIAKKSHYPSIKTNDKGDILVAWSKEELKGSKTMLRMGK